MCGTPSFVMFQVIQGLGRLIFASCAENNRAYENNGGTVNVCRAQHAIKLRGSDTVFHAVRCLLFIEKLLRFEGAAVRGISGRQSSSEAQSKK